MNCSRPNSAFRLQPLAFRLIRPVLHPTGRGPGNGQFALQRELRRRKLPWLAIGGALEDADIPWFWSWEDRAALLACEAMGRPYVAGPNVLFENAKEPCRNEIERELCRAVHCRLWLTESLWYARLMRRCFSSANGALIAVIPYPLDPMPPGPRELHYDLLIYAKSGYRGATIARLRRRFRRVRILRYGRYRRAALVEAASTCAACVYLSDDDRGPLALAEILASGCPTVGLPHGAPFLIHGQNGYFVPDLECPALLDAVRRARTLDRRQIAHAAHLRFHPAIVVNRLMKQLAGVLEGG